MSNGPTNYFLLVYRLEAREVEIEEFGADDAAAARIYSEREREHGDDPDVEVVLVGADSIETVRKTHSHYFTTTAVDELFSEIEKALAAVVKQR